ncbi:MAG: DRTGG domain-containing protein [Bacillota bacterium]|nr:DRTGG domain-containing protein [Bacillota bacterium]
MTVAQLAEQFNLKLLAGEQGTNCEFTGCYVGDLLSWVMGRAKSGDIWLTVMGNINAIAVASLADIACIVLTENAALDDDAKAKADTLGIPIYITEESSFHTAMKIGQLL